MKTRIVEVLKLKLNKQTIDRVLEVVEVTATTRGSEEASYKAHRHLSDNLRILIRIASLPYHDNIIKVLIE